MDIDNGQAGTIQMDEEGLNDARDATDRAWDVEVEAFQTTINELKREHNDVKAAYRTKMGLLREQHEKLRKGYDILQQQQQREQQQTDGGGENENDDENKTTTTTTTDNNNNDSRLRKNKYVSDNDLLEINISGKTIYVQRGVLRQMKGSRLERLFSGRWDKALRQGKNDGPMFLDVNYIAFKIIVDYLERLKAGSPMEEDEPFITSLSQRNKVFLDRLCHLFGLKNYASNPCPCLTIGESAILDELEDSDSRSLIGFLEEDSVHGDLELVYRASRDGWGTYYFHRNCDDRGPTVTVVKSSEGYVFGGYSDVSWTCDNDYKTSAKAFLFALKSYSGLGPTKMRQMTPSSRVYAVYHGSDYGPIFGRGHDVLINTNANGDLKSYTSIGSKDTYRLPSGQIRNFITGSKFFKAAEVEVFRVVSPKDTKRKDNAPVVADSSDGSSVGDSSSSIDNENLSVAADGSGNDASSSSVSRTATTRTKIEPWQTMKFDEFPEDLKEAMVAEQRELLSSWDTLLDSEIEFREEKMFVDFFITGDFVDMGRLLDPSGGESSANHPLLFDDEEEEEEEDSDGIHDWTFHDVVEWAKTTRGITRDVWEIFEQEQITGTELLALEREDLKDLGITRPGTLAVTLKAIQSLRTTTKE